MAAKSKNWLDVYVWIDKVLDSCVTKEQVDNTRHLFLRFEAMYNTSYISGTINDLVCNLYRKSITLRDDICEKDLINRIKKNIEDEQKSSIGNDGNIS